jgi:hypothetical protein
LVKLDGTTPSYIFVWYLCIPVFSSNTNGCMKSDTKDRGLWYNGTRDLVCPWILRTRITFTNYNIEIVVLFKKSNVAGWID